MASSCYESFRQLFQKSTILGHVKSKHEQFCFKEALSCIYAIMTLKIIIRLCSVRGSKCFSFACWNQSNWLWIKFFGVGARVAVIVALSGIMNDISIPKVSIKMILLIYFCILHSSLLNLLFLSTKIIQDIFA